MAEAEMEKCGKHPERTAVARCVKCGKPLCAECARRADGRYFCEWDYAGEPAPDRATLPVSAPRPWLLAAVVALAAAVGGAFWLLRPLVVESAKTYGAGMTDRRLAETADALDGFKRDMGRYPTEAEGLAALVKEPPGGGRWLGPYLPATAFKGERVVDGAGRPIVYRLEGGKHVLVGAGEDGRFGTKDDVRLTVEDRPRAGEQPEGRKPLGEWFGKSLGRA